MVQTNVYIARALQALYQPGITYSDKGICGGAYKNGGEEAEDDKDREEMEKLIAESLLKENKIVLFPNPASELLTVKYRINSKNNATLEIVDMLGSLQTTLHLKPDVQVVTANINTLQNGVYIYRYIMDGKTLQTGKLLITK